MNCRYCNGPVRECGVVDFKLRQVKVMYCRPCNRVGADVPLSGWPTKTPGWEAQWRVLVETALVEQERLGRFLSGDFDREFDTQTSTYGD
jgi:hypothetical protein